MQCSTLQHTTALDIKTIQVHDIDTILKLTQIRIFHLFLPRNSTMHNCISSYHNNTNYVNNYLCYFNYWLLRDWRMSEMLHSTRWNGGLYVNFWQSRQHERTFHEYNITMIEHNIKQTTIRQRITQHYTTQYHTTLHNTIPHNTTQHHTTNYSNIDDALQQH